MGGESRAIPGCDGGVARAPDGIVRRLANRDLAALEMLTVLVGPPLSCSPLGSSRGSTLSPKVCPLAPVELPKPQEVSSEMLSPPSVTIPEQFKPLLLAKMQFVSVMEPPLR